MPASDVGLTVRHGTESVLALRQRLLRCKSPVNQRLGIVSINNHHELSSATSQTEYHEFTVTAVFPDDGGTQPGDALKTLCRQQGIDAIINRTQMANGFPDDSSDEEDDSDNNGGGGDGSGDDDDDDADGGGGGGKKHSVDAAESGKTASKTARIAS